MKLSDLKAGDVVSVDGSQNLYVSCSHGSHLLDGQEDENGELVGISSEAA